METKSNVYIISWILWDIRDISWHMIEKITDTSVLLVEEKNEVEHFFKSLSIDYKGIVIEMDGKWLYLNKYRKLFLKCLSAWKNIWLFEAWWAACFYDPGSEFVDYIHSKIKEWKFNIKMTPVIWWSALMTAISVSWFSLEKFFFWWFLWEDCEKILKKSKDPVIFFQKHEEFDDIKKALGFMKKEDNKKVFIWVNLWKRFNKENEHKTNILIRWTYSNSYEKFIDLYKNDNDIRNITFIFNV